MSMPLARTYSDEDDNDQEETTQEVNHTEAEARHAEEYEHGPEVAAAATNVNGPNPQPRIILSLEPIRQFVAVASIEPLLLLFRLAMSITDVTIQTFYMETVCRDKYRDQIQINCSDLTETEKKEIETMTTKYFTYREIIESGVPIIIVLIMELHPKALLIASIPIALGGTFAVFLVSAMKHIASSTSTESRSFRIAIAEIIWQIGSPIGLLAALPILKHFGYKPVFVLAAVIYFLCMIYTIIFVTNDKPQNELIPLDLVESDSFKCRPLFNLSNLTDTVQSCFRKREGLKRIWLMALFTILFCRFLVLIGDYDIAYLYTYHKFNWTGRDYTFYQTTVSIFGFVGSTLLTVVSFKLFHWPDPLVGLISGVSYLGGLIMITVAARGFMMYIGAAFQMFSRLIAVIVRSLSSKIVAKQEIGKIYSFLGCIESITPLLASIIFNAIFLETKDTFPGAVYVLCSVLASLVTFLYLFLFVSMKGQLLHQEVEGHPAGVEPQGGEPS